MGIWITVGIVLFVLGSIMGLKPSGIDQRTDKVRMAARKLALNPKLVACPDWLRGKDDEYGRGMMGQYGIVVEGYKMPHVRYHAVDGKWRPVTIDGDVVDFSLDKVAIDLPENIIKHTKGLEAKANSIVLYWDDVAYVRPATNPSYHEKNIETDLYPITQKLTQWASLIMS
ncbi:hypothetical protein VH441_09110 [Psychrobacter sp. HD31]|uniref:hypothetical protein n=1 Tax=Psychrobacter sp. HD31 TaxID=3112003 RepID=UPI003DA48D9E